MFRSKFETQRPRELVERAERVRRLHQLRRMLAEVESPFAAFASDLAIDEHRGLLSAALH